MKNWFSNAIIALKPNRASVSLYFKIRQPKSNRFSAIDEKIKKFSLFQRD
jgi:hypothetical protein